MTRSNIKLTSTVLLVLSYFLTTTAQNIYTFAGNGVQGYSGDGGPAINGQLFNPYGIAVGLSGDIYIADAFNACVRKVNSSGTISTYAGTSIYGFSGDGGPAINAQLSSPRGICTDASGSLFIADHFNSRIRKVSPGGIISTIAGTIINGYSGDGGLAINAQINYPFGITVDISGNIYFADQGNYRIRKINTAGVISTFAGTGVGGFSGDGGSAALAQIGDAYGLAVDASGNIYIADYSNNRIRKVNSSGTISTFAGTGVQGFSGDGGTAINAQLNLPVGVTVDALNNVYVSEYGNNRIRKINPAGIISTFAGNGVNGFSGDGFAATLAQIDGPIGIAIDASSSLYIADRNNERVRKVCTNNCFTSINSFENKISKLLIFPNPNNGSFKIQIDDEVKNFELILINSLGQKVHEQKISQKQNNIITRDLASGIYYYIILQDKVKIINGKLTVE